MAQHYFQLLTRARRNAKRDYSAWAVVEMDHEDGRKLFCVPLDYTDYDEFLAFDGHIEAIAWGDGLVENCSVRNA